MTIIKTFDTEENGKKFPKKYIILTLLSLFMLTLIEIWANNTIASFGGQFGRLSDLKKNLEMENQILENEIAKEASLNSIASKSAQLGFSKSKSIQYIR